MFIEVNNIDDNERPCLIPLSSIRRVWPAMIGCFIDYGSPIAAINATQSYQQVHQLISDALPTPLEEVCLAAVESITGALGELQSEMRALREDIKFARK